MSLNELPPLRAIISEYGLKADKRFGQHYLMDLNLTDKIARLCGDVHQASVIEVGPGPGGLTRSLLSQGAGQLIAIEKDTRFFPALEMINEVSHNRLKLVEADALNIVEAEIEFQFTTRILASNLPYNIGTALLIKWLEANPIWWSRLVLMFQKEVAQRVTAKPGEKHYGRLAILTCAMSKARYSFTLPARAFTPPPKVDSAVVVIDPLPASQCFKDLNALSIVTESAFGQRRKTLRQSLKAAAAKAGISSDRLLEDAEIDPSVRAETIDPQGFFKLAKLWRKAKGYG